MKIADARHAFITGGASGIGLGIAKALAARGVAVTLADLNADALAEAAAGCEGQVRTVQLDVRDRAGWEQARKDAHQAFGQVDLLFNNAGIAPDGKPLAESSPEGFDRVMAINLTGVYNGVHAFAPSMQAAGRGHIVNTASMSGMVMDGPGITSYGASKAAVIAISEVLRMEMEPHGIGVSVLCPSYVATELMANTVRAGGAVRDPTVSLMGAPTKPEHVAPMVLEAIEANQPFILTHGSRRGAVEERHAAVMACFDAADRWEAEHAG